LVPFTDMTISRHPRRVPPRGHGKTIRHPEAAGQQ
jgi:hypothetical protein